MKPKYSIIIPTYNERENIPTLILLLVEQFGLLGLAFQVVVVDDNSPDGTQAVVKELQQQHGQYTIELVTRPRKLGLGSAYMHGLQYATGDFVILMDADLSHHPKYIPEFIKRQRETQCDIVTGTRYRKPGGIVGWRFHRKLISWGANTLASVLLRSSVSDLTGAFRLYKRGCLEKLLPLITSKGYAFQMEVVIRAQRLKLRIEEVPIVFVDRIHGVSKLGPSEFMLFLKGLLVLLFNRS